MRRHHPPCPGPLPRLPSTSHVPAGTRGKRTPTPPEHAVQATKTSKTAPAARSGRIRRPPNQQPPDREVGGGCGCVRSQGHHDGPSRTELGASAAEDGSTDRSGGGKPLPRTSTTPASPGQTPPAWTAREGGAAADAQGAPGDLTPATAKRTVAGLHRRTGRGEAPLVEAGARGSPAAAFRRAGFPGGGRWRRLGGDGWEREG